MVTGTALSSPVATRRDARAWWLCAGAVTAMAGGALQVVTAVRHVEHGGLVVGFFLLVAAAQIGGGAWLAMHALTGLPPDRRVLLVGLLGTTALIGLLVIASTTDLLLAYVSRAPGHSHPALHAGPFAAGVSTRNDTLESVREAPGPIGTLTVALAVGTLAALTGLLPRRWRGRVTSGLLAVGGIAWLLWLTGLLR